MKRVLSMFAAMAMVIALSACGKQAGAEQSSPEVSGNVTYTGTVSAISGDSITISTGSGDVVVPLTDSTVFVRGFVMGGMEEMSGDMGDMPGGTGEQPDGGEAPPEKPEGDARKDAPMEQLEGGERNQPDGTPPEMSDGQQPGEGGEAGSERGEGKPDMGVDPQDLTLADLTLGDTVTVETDENGNAVSVALSGGEMGMGGPGRMQPGAED